MFRTAAIGAILALSLTSTIQIANSEDAAPKGNKGFTASNTTVVDLGPEIEGMAGRQLRMRMLTILADRRESCPPARCSTTWGATNMSMISN